MKTLQQRIMSLFSFAVTASGGDGQTATVIIDAESLTPSAGSGRQPSAQEKIAALNRLSLFAEKERLLLTAILYGHPLRSVADGDSSRGVTVRYVAGKEDTARFVAGLLQKTGSRGNTLVVTADRQVEKSVLASGFTVMHTGTLKKALEPVEAPPHRRHNARQNGHGPAREREDENKRIVNELIDPL